jgi:signal-transduction protein with cAMP-binding, CBS, and nucleotidyltransferase domain
MDGTIADVMTRNVLTLPGSASVVDAAKAMKERHVDEVIVMRDGKAWGILTDRDVVRLIAENGDPAKTEIAKIANSELVSLRPNAWIGDALDLMSWTTVREIVVTEDGRPLGILKLGELATAIDPAVMPLISALSPLVAE